MENDMKKCDRFILAIVPVLVLRLAYVPFVSAETPDSAVVVSIEGSSFSPEVIHVKAGGEVVWKNKDAAVHTVTADDGSFDSGALGQGDKFKRKFPSTGTFKYSCDNHSWMKGTIEVR